MKIQAVFTGGTIASRQGSGGRLAPQREAMYHLIEWYKKQYGGDTDFVTAEPYFILSENLSAGHLNKLIECIKEVLVQGDADGILVMHGTDTLQYTAAVLGYVFDRAEVPIVLVSSDFPLTDGRANGYSNFVNAVRFVKGAYGRGVFVSYQNPGGIPAIHRGTRLLAHTAYSSAVESVRGICYGTFRQEEYVPNPDYRAKASVQTMFRREDRVVLSPDAAGILRIVPYVGMSYPKLDHMVKAVLHESYHSGTIAVGEGFRWFAAEAGRLGIPVYLTGLPAGEAEYETVGICREAGIQPLPESSPVSQYCKLWLAVSNGLPLEKVMGESIAEDFLM